MAILVLAPIFEEIEDREDSTVRIFLEMAVNSDVAPVANFLGKICRVKDEFRFEECVVLICRQEAKIELHAEVAHGLVQEPRMAGFIPSHMTETFSQ